MHPDCALVMLPYYYSLILYHFCILLLLICIVTFNVKVPINVKSVKHITFGIKEIEKSNFSFFWFLSQLYHATITVEKISDLKPGAHCIKLLPEKKKSGNIWNSGEHEFTIDFTIMTIGRKLRLK